MRRLLAAACAMFVAAATLSVAQAHPSTGLGVARAAVESQQPAAGGTEAVERGVAYLVVEVPRWRREHPCYSCHNNGDAVRALVAAAGRGHDVGTSIDDTLSWLATPERWDSNAQRGGSDDLPLGRIQFASTLQQMVVWDRAEQGALDRASALLLPIQKEDGSFRPNETQTVGGATAYGPMLATAMAHRVLSRSRLEEAQTPAALARRWMRRSPLATVLDASSVLIGLERDGDEEAVARRMDALRALKQAQGPDGGWGPFATSQSDVFDTALGLMALVMVRNVEQLHDPVYTVREVETAIAAARNYLLAMQNPDGSWPETTRPANGESYAQRISTTAWAIQSLMASE